MNVKINELCDETNIVILGYNENWDMEVQIVSQVIIEMHNVTKKVNNNKKTVLHDVNLTIERGDSVALIGVNGTGKSTLLRLISGLTPISSGKVLTVPNLKFAFIPEHFPKLNMTVDEYMHTVGRIDGLSKQEISSISKKEDYQEL